MLKIIKKGHNRMIFLGAIRRGCNYLVNPVTKKLHDLCVPFEEQRELHSADLENFWMVWSFWPFSWGYFPDGTRLLLFDQFGYVLPYKLNRCQYCFEV